MRNSNIKPTKCLSNLAVQLQIFLLLKDCLLDFEFLVYQCFCFFMGFMCELYLI